MFENYSKAHKSAMNHSAFMRANEVFKHAYMRGGKMQLKLIKAKTKLEIQVVTTNSSEGNQAAVINGEFLEMGKDSSFYITCNELYTRFNELKENILKFTFNDDSENYLYTFDGKMSELHIKDGVKAILVTATSLIEETNRRSAPRIKTGIATRIYETEADAANKTGKLISEGVTFDISITGISFLTNERLKLHSGSYVVEFSLFQPDIFYLPVKYVRNEDNPRSNEYNYDYAFMFACEHDSLEVGKLTQSLFRYKMGIKL